MQIDKIISMASGRMRLRFLVMERSLRATGCDLPLRVIPYDNDLFELPKNSTWWQIAEVTDWLATEKAHPVMRKYQCLTQSNYQFVDADVCFLKNPETVLSGHQGFVTSCGHWRSTRDTTTTTSQEMMARTSTNWPQRVFNTGQFACSQRLYDIDDLQKICLEAGFLETCLRFPYHEQPGINLLVFASGIDITNLTLPPTCMESTWAGDYPDDYGHYWADQSRQPYLIHWAGTPMDVPRPINSIFYDFLTGAEKSEWDKQLKQVSAERRKKNGSVLVTARRFKGAVRAFIKA